MLASDGGYAVKKFDVMSGSYSTVYEIPSTPAYSSLGGCALNPIDSKMYGVFSTRSAKNTSFVYLARFDDTNIEVSMGCVAAVCLSAPRAVQSRDRSGECIIIVEQCSAAVVEAAGLLNGFCCSS